MQSYILDKTLSTLNFVIFAAEASDEELEWMFFETPNEIFSFCQNPTAVEFIKNNISDFTEEDDNRAAFISGLCLNTNPAAMKILKNYDDLLTEEDLQTLSKNPAGRKLYQKILNYASN